MSDSEEDESTPAKGGKREAKERWKRRALAAVNEDEDIGTTLLTYGGGHSQVLLNLPDDYAERGQEERRQKRQRNAETRKKNRVKRQRTRQSELEPLAKSLIEQLFEGIPAQIRTPRDFNDDRERQVLRWTATSLLTMLPSGVEVQCYYENGTVYITSNDVATNRKLQALLEEHHGDLVAVVTDSYEAIAKAGERQERHAKKLIGRAMSRVYEEQDPILDCLTAGKVNVVQGSEEGLHAERRIQRFLQRKLDPRFLAGVKRPCAICAVALELTGRCFPGPTWISAAATQGMEPDAFIETLAEHVEHCDGAVEDVVTYITRMRSGELTTGFDSESDSDAEDDDLRDDEEEEEDESLLRDDLPEEDDEGTTTASLYEQEVRASRLLIQNNCLINAIALEAFGRTASVPELVRIRGRLQNVGEMMIADPATIDVIREELEIDAPVVVYNAGQNWPEEHDGDGDEITIHNTGGLHFAPGAPKM